MASNPLLGDLGTIVVAFRPEREHRAILNALVSCDFQIDFFRSKLFSAETFPLSRRASLKLGPHYEVFKVAVRRTAR